MENRSGVYTSGIMKIFKDVLSQELYDTCISDLTDKLQSSVWKSSIINWPSSVIEGITGSCIFSMIDSDLSSKISNRISKLFDISSYEIVMQYCAWQPHSGLSLHDDSNHKMGGTIYLNDNWNINNGGIFLWKNKNQEEEIYNAILPTKNMLVLNDEKELHLVTPVSSNSQDLRATIQIWFN